MLATKLNHLAGVILKFARISERFMESLRNGVPVENSVVLTFDDGLCDHYDVTQELLKRGLWGIFYISTGCYTTGKLLDVHRIHMLLGKYGGPPIYEALQEILAEDMVVEQELTSFFESIVYMFIHVLKPSSKDSLVQN